ncbi:MAG: pentapeptide repeat-containing protein [Gammaproteobacteria bacterium]
MNIKLKSVIVLLLAALSTSVFAEKLADPEHVKKFYATGSCINCELSEERLIYRTFCQNSDMQGSNLSRSTVRCDFSSANFSGINGIRAIFDGHNYTRTNFSNAILIGATFTDRNMGYADFSGANVRDADFSKTILYGSKITKDQLDSAKSVCGAVLPDGSTGQCK